MLEEELKKLEKLLETIEGNLQTEKKDMMSMKDVFKQITYLHQRS
jgi:hypothetical protein